MVPGIISELLQHFLGPLAKQQLHARFDKATPAVVAGMVDKGMTPDKAEIPLVIRDALFRLIRSQIPSGDISDYIRDVCAKDVIKRVLALPKPPQDLAGLVAATGEAFIEHVF
jgi:hypothetical protein